MKSKQWFSRHSSDSYVKQAQASGYRSRAAYKLLEIDEKYDIFATAKTIIDLGAAPGSWCQVVSQKVACSSSIIAVDQHSFKPIANVDIVVGDFCDLATVKAVDAILCAKKADVILSDMSPDLSGIDAVDQFTAASLVECALSFCQRRLHPNGTFVCKIFHGSEFQQVLQLFSNQFVKTKIVKPKASRSISKETYIYAQELVSV